VIQGPYKKYREKFRENRFISDIATMPQNSSKYNLFYVSSLLQLILEFIFNCLPPTMKHVVQWRVLKRTEFYTSILLHGGQ
jgi:hypothetical protein